MQQLGWDARCIQIWNYPSDVFNIAGVWPESTKVSACAASLVYTTYAVRDRECGRSRWEARIKAIPLHSSIGGNWMAQG